VTLAITGFFLGRIPYIPDLISSSQHWWSTRHALGFPTAIPMGQYAFAVMLGLLIFGPRIFALKNRGFSMLWLIAIGIALQFLVISQSRSVWLAAPIFVSATILVGWQMKIFSKKQVGGVLAAIVALAIVTAAIQASTIQKRLTTESETWNQIFEGDIDQIPSTRETGTVKSIGIRVNMIEFGFEKWLERPVFGWGPGASKMLIQCCAPESFQLFNDLHSAYPETLMRFGLAGTLILVALVLSLIRDGIKGAQEGGLPRDVLLFVLICLALHFVVAIANYRVINYDWRFYWIFFAGIAMAFSPHFAAQGDPIKRNAIDNDETA
jgi:O-antigen ligase